MKNKAESINMIKGCQKKIIHVTNTKSPYFEEAYFVLKRSSDIVGVTDDDMVKEALRIAEDAVKSVKLKTSRKWKSRAAAALVGAAVISFVFGGIMLFFTVSKG